MKDIIYKIDVKLDKDDIFNLYNDVGWVEYTKDLQNLLKAIKRSLTTITAWHNNKLVGLVRVVGDGFTIIYIQDIIVHRKYQRKQIVTTLVKKILNRYKDVRQCVLLTEESRAIRNFYESLEFESCDRGSLVSFIKSLKS
ncbi:GNAT family N-acetyltransferase [Candidatus Parcubacteria bacterium]|nr:GNAT family N-acetyltransferase [Candidatus Parcubacteria bacterium]